MTHSPRWCATNALRTAPYASTGETASSTASREKTGTVIAGSFERTGCVGCSQTGTTLARYTAGGPGGPRVMQCRSARGGVHGDDDVAALEELGAGGGEHHSSCRVPDDDVDRVLVGARRA